jgi:hypothetical protein
MCGQIEEEIVAQECQSLACPNTGILCAGNGIKSSPCSESGLCIFQDLGTSEETKACPLVKYCGLFGDKSGKTIFLGV